MSLFNSLELRSISIRNRIGMSPMCTYSCESKDGIPGAWHLHHLASRAAGGCGLIIAEATAIEPCGRISLQDCGMWNQAQADSWQPITAGIKSMGAVPCLQLAHAGRKAGTRRPWDGRGAYTDEEFTDGNLAAADLHPVGASPIPFNKASRTPRELEAVEMVKLAARWAKSSQLAAHAGFEAVEIHMAHGYLLHSFLSPLSNQRKDSYGGDLSGRMRFPLMVAEAVRDALPENLPLLVRISCTDWEQNGWGIDEAVIFSSRLKQIGVDLVDCSSGGLVPSPSRFPTGDLPEGYQVQFAKRIKADVSIPTAAVGMVRTPAFANRVVQDGNADMVLLGRELLRNPYWANGAAKELGCPPPWPNQYGWAVGP